MSNQVSAHKLDSKPSVAEQEEESKNSSPADKENRAPVENQTEQRRSKRSQMALSRKSNFEVSNFGAYLDEEDSEANSKARLSGYSSQTP